MKKLQVLDTVAILKPISIDRLTLVETEFQAIASLPSGQVGTIVEVYPVGEDEQYLVEFADSQGCEYAMAILKKDEILALSYELTVA